MLITRAELASLKLLTTKAGRDAEGRFLLEGWRALAEALRAEAVPECVVVDPRRADAQAARALLAELRTRGVPIKECEEKYLHRLSSTEHGPGVVAALPIARRNVDDALRPGRGLAVALDGLADPGNLGTILRTCEWFGAVGVLLGRGCVELHNDKVVRATAGALFHLPVAEDVELPAALTWAREQGYRVVVFAGDGRMPLPELAPTPRDLLVFGGEARGAAPAVRAVADVVVRVPGFGRGESLNVAIACGVALAHLRFSR